MSNGTYVPHTDVGATTSVDVDAVLGDVWLRISTTMKTACVDVYGDET